MYQLKFNLKQHTPIIHFQHDQQGATLRATELKPKLDFFIMKKLLAEREIKEGGQPIPDHKVREKFKKVADERGWKNWLVGKGRSEHVALDYKVKIQSDGDITSIPIKYSKTREGKWRPNFPCIFGNVEDEEKKNMNVVTSIIVHIITPNRHLCNSLEQNFCKFLMHTNFGFRQSKGFGSFTIDPEDKNYGSNFNDLKLKYSFEINDINSRFKEPYQRRLFTVIDVFYKSLRSGINIPKDPRDRSKACKNLSSFYFKSLLFYYLKEVKNKQWDKKTIKDWYLGERKQRDGTVKPAHSCLSSQLKLNTDPNSQLNYSAKGQTYLYRDLFGLSSEERWLTYGKTISKKHSVLVNGKCQELNEDDPNRKVRFKSPIHFKPIFIEKDQMFKVHFEAKPIPTEYKGTMFKILSNDEGTLCRAIANDFDFADFFSWISDRSNFDISNYVDKQFQRRDDAGNYSIREMGILTDVFEQLQHGD